MKNKKNNKRLHRIKRNLVRRGTEDEKHIIEILKANEGISIGDLKTKSELSGKKWDAASKGLSKHGLMRVVVDGENKIAEYLGK